jgi:hypothetical protein
MSGLAHACRIGDENLVGASRIHPHAHCARGKAIWCRRMHMEDGVLGHVA